MGDIVLGRGSLAFSFYRGRTPRLYVARYAQHEFPIARGETPLTFLRSGELLTRRGRGGAILLRAAGGAFERLVAPRSGFPVVDQRRGVVAFRAGGRLFLVESGAIHPLGSLRALGVPDPLDVELTHGLVAIRDKRRLVVLRADGSVFASGRLPPRRDRADGVSSTVVADASGHAVAFAATHGNSAGGSTGRESVYVLAAGAHRARAVYTERMRFEVCERSAYLAWHGRRWLLYSASEHVAAVVDVARGRAVRLTSALARLPGIRGDFFSAAWGDAQPSATRSSVRGSHDSTTSSRLFTRS